MSLRLTLKLQDNCSCGWNCSDGGPQTPAHHCSDFSFKTYAPVAFQYFRELFDIRSEDYMVCIFTFTLLRCIQGMKVALHGSETWPVKEATRKTFL